MRISKLVLIIAIVIGVFDFWSCSHGIQSVVRVPATTMDMLN